MIKRLLLLLLFCDEFFISAEKEESEDLMHEIYVDDVK